MSAQLTILSYNINRSPSILDHLLASPQLSDLDAILLQEPPQKLASHPLPRGWKAILPTPHTSEEPNNDRPRAAILISPLYQPADIRQRPLPSRDLVDVELRVNEGGPVRLLSLYNPLLFAPAAQQNRTLRHVLPPILPSFSPLTPLILAGDFNLRHPLWDPRLLDPPSDEAEQARLTFEDSGLLLLRPPGYATFFGSSGEVATLDLALGNLLAEEMLVSATIDNSYEYGSDHCPLRVSLLLAKAPSRP
ncbi:hypothetical protein JCM11251_004203, partial [Rhodosporidiobolus azoricus]